MPPELRSLLQRCSVPRPTSAPEHFDAVPDRDVLLRLENNVRLRLAKREDWPGAARSLDRMLAIAPDRRSCCSNPARSTPGSTTARAAIAAFERFLATGAAQADRELRQRASALLQELRRGLN